MTLSIEEFGAQLIKTGDLDPVYIAIDGVPMKAPQRDRLCVAYWCFYSLGAAAKIAELGKTPKEFWYWMGEAAANTHVPPVPSSVSERWPRAAERRHFRGRQAIDAVGELAAKYKTATDAMCGLTGAGKGMTYASVTRAAESHRGFGQWIGWKIADMAERVLGFPVDFSAADLGIYKDPRQGAALAFYEGSVLPHYKSAIGEGVVTDTYLYAPWNYPISDSEMKTVLGRYVKHFSRYPAPPKTNEFGKRPCNVQEVETVFCKYKSYRKGHYVVGKDIREVGHGLTGWGDLADELRAALPKAPA